MIKIAIFCAIVGCALALYPIKKAEKVDPPSPYEFSYNIEDEEGNTQARQESGDDKGFMKGSYEITSVNGLRRWVEYVADGEGFRAWITTNEPGTDAQNPADVQMTVNETPVLKEPTPKKEIKQAYKTIRVPVGYEGCQDVQARQESGDENGNMKGSYEISSTDGLRRWVEYVADGEGFRVWITTNEPGTGAQNPADVQMTVQETPQFNEAPRKKRRPERKGNTCIYTKGRVEEEVEEEHPTKLLVFFESETDFEALIAIFCAIVGCALALYPIKKAEKVDPPSPYEFSYNIEDEEGNTQARQESGDDKGFMKGSYEITSVNGLRRWVEYVADGEGFRAWITTNEPGTDAQNPADVQMTVNETPELKEPTPKKEIKQAYKTIRVPVGYGGY
ncbi:Cuticle protein 16.8 [Nymphon striatum]|nr:Cuticle protein 16.8 [Nymphon striatum]